MIELLLFADDTSIFYSHSNPKILESVLNNELKNIEVWLRCNKLSVNVKKTTYLIFKPWQKKFNHNFSFSLGGQRLTQTNATKFLGVYIDEHLTWKYHISYLCKQISKSIGMLFRSRFYLSSKTKLTLYYSLIYPYITYCNSTWSSTYVTNLNRIYCLQKRAVRAITNSEYSRAVHRIFSLRGQTSHTFTGVSRIQTGFLVSGRFVFTPTQKVASKTFKKQTTLMLFVLNCHDLLWHKHLI